VDGAAFDEQIEALEQERAFIDLRGWGLTEVRGADAEGWLNDLITASLVGLPEDRAPRSFLLSPTGRIRADLFVLRSRGSVGFVLLQDARQPDAIADLLGPYVLSSEVELSPVDPGGLLVKPRPGLWWTAAWEAPDDGSVPAGPEALEAWRIRQGLARFPVDLDVDSLPAEADLDVDRSEQGLLPGPGVRCPGAEPRPPTAAGPRGQGGDTAPAGRGGPFAGSPGRERHQRGAARRIVGDGSYPLGRKGYRSHRQ
jgi:Aminomethyltransferase folate-binding domain